MDLFALTEVEKRGLYHARQARSHSCTCCTFRTGNDGAASRASLSRPHSGPQLALASNANMSKGIINRVGKSSGEKGFVRCCWRSIFLLLLLATVLFNVIRVHQHESQREERATVTGVSSIRDNFRVPPSAADIVKQVHNRNEPADQGLHKVAGLSCKDYDGPSDQIAAEMVYWRDIPSDAEFVSPLKSAGPKAKYLTFEPGRD